LGLLEKEGIPTVTVDGNLKEFTKENVKRSVMKKIEPLLK